MGMNDGNMKYCIQKILAKVFSKIYVLEFVLFCVFVVQSIYNLILSSGQTDFTISNCMMYLLGQNTHYYLIIAPMAIISLNGLTNFDTYSNYELVRFHNRKHYAWVRVGEVFFFCTVAVAIFALAAVCLYFPFCSSTQSWMVCNDFWIAVGLVIVQNALYSISEVGLVIAQMSMTILSLVATGLLLLLLKAYIRNKNLPTACVLVGNFAMHLMCHVNLIPSFEWIAPYSHTFLKYMDSEVELLANFLYWGVLIVILTALCICVIEKRDYVANSSIQDNT